MRHGLLDVCLCFAFGGGKATKNVKDNAAGIL
jgi:hypothetical protein